MKIKIGAFMAVAALLVAQLACNMPTVGGSSSNLPAPERTLTALFGITLTPQEPTQPAELVTPTATLPPVVTATSAGGEQPTNTPDDANTGGGQAATATQPAATATSAPTQAASTNTPRPTVPTATVPSVRPRSPVVAKFLSTPPTLDGDWSEWKDLTTEYSATNVVFGQNNWTGEDDLAGSFHVGWDNNNLYIAVKVRDDQYVQNATGENIFQGDSIEILLDTKVRDDYFYDALSPDDFQLGISPGRPDVNGTKEAYLWFPRSVAGTKSNIQIASRLENGIYRVEAAIPWSLFEVTPAADMHLGFALSISDNDNTGANVQQTMVSNVAGRSLTNPTTWGDLKLER